MFSDFLNGFIYLENGFEWWEMVSSFESVSLEGFEAARWDFLALKYFFDNLVVKSGEKSSKL